MKVKPIVLKGKTLYNATSSKREQSRSCYREEMHSNIYTEPNSDKLPIPQVADYMPRFQKNALLNTLLNFQNQQELSQISKVQNKQFDRNYAAMQTQQNNSRSSKIEKNFELPPIPLKTKSSMGAPLKSENPYKDESNYVTLDFVNAVIARGHKGEKFKDSVFPPETMINGMGRLNKLPEEKKEPFSKLKYRRAAEIFDKPCIFAPQSDLMLNLQQKWLSNCYLMASLTALAKDENLIRNLFVTKTVNKAGIYAFNFMINGVQRIVCVDDFFPVKINQPLNKEEKKETQLQSQDKSTEEEEKPFKLAFGRSRNASEMWVSLLEKAWSKLIGGYAAVENGPCSIVYPLLVNKPSYDIKHNRDAQNHGVDLPVPRYCELNLVQQPENPIYYEHNLVQQQQDSDTDLWDVPLWVHDILWNKIKRSLDQGYPLTCNTAKKLTVDRGVMQGHVYAIVHYFEDGEVRELIMKDPLGSKVWNGDSNLLSTQAKEYVEKLVGDVEKSGYFAIPFSEYLRPFSHTTIRELAQFQFSLFEIHKFKNFIDRTRSYVFEEDYISSHTAFYKIGVTTGVKAPLCFMLHPDGNRLGTMRQKTNQYIPNSFSLGLFRMKGNNRVIKTTHNEQFCPFLTIRNDLEEGNYMLVIDARWNKIANSQSIFKAIKMIICSKSALTVDEMTTATGISELKKVMAKQAKKCIQQGKVSAFKGDFDYAFNIIESHPIKNFWFGFLYTQNGKTTPEQGQEQHRMKIKYTWDPDGVTVLKEPQDTKSDKKQYKFKILVGNNQLVLLHSDKLYSYYKWICQIEPNEQEWSEQDLQDYISNSDYQQKQ